MDRCQADLAAQADGLHPGRAAPDRGDRARRGKARQVGRRVRRARRRSGRGAVARRPRRDRACRSIRSRCPASRRACAISITNCAVSAPRMPRARIGAGSKSSKPRNLAAGLNVRPARIASFSNPNERPVNDKTYMFGELNGRQPVCKDAAPRPRADAADRGAAGGRPAAASRPARCVQHQDDRRRRRRDLRPTCRCCSRSAWRSVSRRTTTARRVSRARSVI